MRDGGKGDTPRPLGVPMEVFDKNFEAIFGKKPQKTLKDYIEEKQDADNNKESNGKS